MPPSQRQIRVFSSDVIEQHPGELTKNKVAEKAGGKRQSTLLAVNILYREGYVTSERGRLGHPVYTSLKPYRETDHLVEIALEDQEGLFERYPHLAIYRKRLKLIALCQGGALHFLDCKRGLKQTNGVKDLDVYSFYAEHPTIPWPYRRHGVKDFGESEFGYHPIRRAGFVGRHVDLMGRAMAIRLHAEPIEVIQAVRRWLATSSNPTPRHLRKKAVVGLYPAPFRREIIWDHSVDL